MELIINLARFIIILGVLIFIHELGHFMVAKKVGIYVFRFSIGFGKKLIGWSKNGTEYCLSLIPFGGYVKMAGQSDLPVTEEDIKDMGDDVDPDMLVDVPENQKFYNKTVAQRLGVVIAGPAMNFLLGLVLFILVYVLGMHVPAYMKQSIIGDVMDKSPAQEAGLKTGDKILKINDSPIAEWKQITRITLFNIGQPVKMTVERGSETFEQQITPAYYNKDANPGIGIMPYLEAKVEGIQESSPAGAAGLQPGDIVTTVNSEPVSYMNIARQIKTSETSVIHLTINRNGQSQNITVNPNVIGYVKGIEFDGNTVVFANSELYPEINAGDNLIAILDKTTTSLDETTSLLTDNIGRGVSLTFERTIGSFFRPKKVTFSEEAYIDSGYRIGAYFTSSDTTVLEKYPLHQAIIKGTSRTFMSVYELFASLYYLAVGRISPRELAGPVGIYKITADFAKSGFVMLLSLVAFLSVNLSIINLLPIPVLDGGHVLFLSLEGIMRRPLNKKFVETCQKIGFALLMCLIGLTLYNDIVHRIFGK
jgi:regulator of sigma E protease